MRARSFRSADRRGAAAFLVLVLLVLVASICGTLLRAASLRREQLRRDERRLQADWLAESGLDRAAARLAASADYKGERWSVPAQALGGPWGAIVAIDVDDVPDRPDRRRVRARAEYPAGVAGAARQTRQATVGLGTESPGGSR